MSASYELWLTNDVGKRIAYLSTGLDITATRTLNNAGKLSLNVPLSFDTKLIQPDNMIQVWRAPEGMALKLWRVYLIRGWRYEYRGSVKTVTLKGVDVIDLLRRRIVKGYKGSTDAKKFGPADDVMKAYVTGAISDGGSPAPTAGTRVLDRLTVSGNVSLGPYVIRDLPGHSLYTSSGNGVLPILAKASKEYMKEVLFDLEPFNVTGDNISFLFVTYINYIKDVSDEVVFDAQRGNMRDPSLEYDYSEEANYIYVQGQGEETNRKITQVYDASRYRLSIWNRCELSVDAQEATASALTSAGATALLEGRPKVTFNATPLDTEGTRFGRDWDVGYRVMAKFEGIDFPSIIRSVTIRLTPKGESIQSRLDYEGVASLQEV